MSDRLRARQSPGDYPEERPQPRPQTRLPDRMSDNGYPGAVALNTVLARIHALPTISPIVIRALQLTYQESSSAREIVAVMESDTRFSARVIAAANLPLYGLPRTVKTVAEVVMLLGTDALREVVLTAAAGELLHRPLTGYGLRPQEFWVHSVACAMAAEIVAEITGYNNRAEAFIAGLLHDVGKIVLNDDMQSAAPFVRDQMARDHCTFLDAERTVLGYEHCDIGARVVRSWSTPLHIAQAIALHRKPIVERQTVPLAGYVHLGEALVSIAGIGIGFEGLDITLETRVLTDFKFTEAMADIAVSRLVDRLARSGSLLAQNS